MTDCAASAAERCGVTSDDFRAAGRFRFLELFAAASVAASPTADGVGGADFESAARRAAGFADFSVILAGTFPATGAFLSPTTAFLGTGALRVRARNSARAVLAFFRACLAIFLLAFANFRVRLSTALAARTACFAASAWVAALSASRLNLWAAAARFARFSDEREVVAMMRSRQIIAGW
jgi:hypothetical protein